METEKVLFKDFCISSLKLRNRFMASATGDHRADSEGRLTDVQIRRLCELAAGGVALIVTGATYVHPSGKFTENQSSCADDRCIAGFAELTSKVRERGGLVALQLTHAGIISAKYLHGCHGKRAPVPSILPPERKNTDELFPVPDDSCEEMSEDRILEIISSFGDAALRAKAGGFDAVQVHAAHGTLPCSFLSPRTNLRDDRWGGSLQNRLRFHRMIYEDIRKKVGKDFPILVKLGILDGCQGGLTFKEGRQAAEMHAQWGYDAIEISRGIRSKGFETTEFPTEIRRLSDEAYFRKYCSVIRETTDVPLALVGGLRTLSLMEEIVSKGDADLVSLCRPFIREPRLVNTWYNNPGYKAKCISCNGCLTNTLSGKGAVCLVQERLKR
jgi:2,4-dienoyl-CoA reductase-like NADH-dependent reductase (Old Yellow Enzyme family)